MKYFFAEHEKTPLVLLTIPGHPKVEIKSGIAEVDSEVPQFEQIGAVKVEKATPKRKVKKDDG